jgi:peptidoglycan/LPS O-acetylase OafA/YrhL
MLNPRLPQLDGLRAVAVILVMAFHFIPWVGDYAPLGSIGVRLFFVLSGFLITRILLASRGDDMAVALRSFYVRRSLRIFPLFYLVLAIAALINIGPVRNTIGWHVSYLTNVYLFDRGSWHGSISHLWSLAVEEQFYLVWPFVVLLVPERRLPIVIAAMVCVAPLSRMLIGGEMSSVLPLSCVDSLGAGALLALPSTRRSMMSVGFLAGIPLTITSLAFGNAIAFDFGVSLSAAWLVGRAAKGFAGRFGALLTARPVMYVGTISYGLYLYHGFMPYMLGRYISGFVDMSWLAQFALLTIATLAIAAASWRFFEAPVLRFKDRASAIAASSLRQAA